MTQNIDLAAAELNLQYAELMCVQHEFKHMDDAHPYRETREKELLIQLMVLENTIRYLERLIIGNLVEIPITEYLNLKAKENE